eukprot:c15386_g1_i1 orf=123-2693(+)
MMHQEVKCEDFIDLSSDDEDLPRADISNEETSNIAVPLLNSSRQENHSQHNESYDHQRSSQIQKASLLPHAALNVHQSRLFEAEHVVKDKAFVLNDGYVQNLPSSVPPHAYTHNPYASTSLPTNIQQKPITKKFWKAGDYDPLVSHIRAPASGIDHVRVHPKFLHSNATSHKWALGAIAELLDNAIDEVQSGASFVRVDAVNNPGDGSPMFLVQDDGGGMDPDSMRQCMSLGYSQKTTKTTIGQYGNGFKTSTMRLGADVIVFSRCSRNGNTTESIGLLSYTFLRETGKEDIIVPMVDFELPFNSGTRNILLRTTNDDWLQNLHMILQWSPYKTESELLKQFGDISSHGTKIIVYNLWLNDDGELELDFNTDRKDIQLRCGMKTSKSDSLLKKFTNEHISNRLRYSLRAYASILYLRMPEKFQIFLRGEPVQHISIAADLKFPEHILYKPQVGNSIGEVSVITTIGFAKEAPMINVHGFNVYHKNRLIMPFWKVFHENSSRGKGVVGVLEANFMEPAHDKQDFERTPVLQRLEGRLKAMTIEYWNLHCDLIGYQPPRHTTKAVTNVTSTSNSSTGYVSAQNVNNQPGIYPPQAVIATGIPAHFFRVAPNLSSHSSSFQHQSPLDFQTSLGTPNGVAGTSGFPPRYKEAQAAGHCDANVNSIPCQMNSASVHLHGAVADINLRSTFKNPGTAPSTPPQPVSDAELSKQADTTSDGCSNLASSFQSDCSRSSLHPRTGANIGRGNQHTGAQEEVVGKRPATEANLESMDPAKRHVTSAMQSGSVDPGSSAPSSHGIVDAVDSSEEVQQLRLRCKQYFWEKQQLELKVLKLQQELWHAHYKLKAYETQSTVGPKVEMLE